jgi:hypothetical protein
MARLFIGVTMINGKDIYRSPVNGHIYSFSGFGGFMNCSDCDVDGMVNEYDRQEDGLVVWFCSKCEAKHHL